MRNGIFRRRLLESSESMNVKIRKTLKEDTEAKDKNADHNRIQDKGEFKTFVKEKGSTEKNEREETTTRGKVYPSVKKK